jgi:2-keto-3-deoxy-L-rhamnonate aldolase RhmA
LGRPTRGASNWPLDGSVSEIQSQALWEAFTSEKSQTSNGENFMAVQKLREGKRVVGTMVRMVRNPAIAIVAHNAGLDFIMLDMEHGPHTMETVDDVFKVGRTLGLGCFVRVPELTKGYVSRSLDCGATGVMVPMLESVEQANLLVRWAKYAPLGGRGFGAPGGHTQFIGVGPDAISAFTAKANADTITIAQIETAQAIQNIDIIAAVPGIDALLIGPNDLSISMGCAGDFLGDTMEKAIGKVAAAAKKHGKIFGMHGPDPLTERWLPRGLTLVMSNLDTNVLAAGLKTICQKYKS